MTSDTSAIGSAFEALLWAGLDESQHFPATRPVLAHYSSVQSFESILRNQEFWLSHPLLMNDHQELRWGLVEGQRLFMQHGGVAEACGSAERYQLLLSSFKYYFDKFVTDFSHDVYVGCFCRHNDDDRDGLLSMWRAYGANGGGIALVFDTARLEPREDNPLVLAPVAYMSTEARLQWIIHKLDVLAEGIRQLKPDDTELWRGAWHFFYRLKHFSLFTKHKGFSEENEWRLVYSPDHDDDDGEKSLRGMYGYAVTPAGIQPKLKLQLSNMAPLGDLISTVLLGPTAGSYLSQHAVKRMLKTLGFPALSERVTTSSTPFRAP